VRPPEATWFSGKSEVAAPTQDLHDPDREALRLQLDAACPRLGNRVAELLFELNSFHQRADKPVWWEYFDRQDRETEELIDDLESIGGLLAAGAPDTLERSYTFPRQETKMRLGSRAVARGIPGQVSILDFDRRRGRIRLRFTKRVETPPDRLDLIPAGPIDNDVLKGAVAFVTAGLLQDEGRYPAITDFLNRYPPRLRRRSSGVKIIRTNDIVAETIAAICDLDQSCLPIQGPPGTGKTFVSAAAIVELVRRGKRVAVSSNAHKAIDNLLVAIADRASATASPITIAKKISRPDHDPHHPQIRTTRNNNDELLRSANVVGGTVWLFARPDMGGSFDYVFVDEAGQVSIANLIAIATAAQNIVLVGDQMQLSQPIQGIHPGESGLSTLDYLLQDCQTVPPDRGIFLPISRRMHPDLCRVISNLVYEGRLTSDAATARHKVDGVLDLPPFGVVFEEVDHAGNSQSSEEEAKCVEQLFRALCNGRFTDREGSCRRIGVEDILIVSPYNAQVNLLADRLPDGARVGTVDRFQGQEAPVCIVSMATSSGEELPRDIEFLFSLNRLNVAISRAQALAVVVASPRLLDITCRTLDEMYLVNALCFVRDCSRQTGKPFTKQPR
jgi:uncharacterized protein